MKKPITPPKEEWIPKFIIDSKVFKRSAIEAMSCFLANKQDLCTNLPDDWKLRFKQ